MALFLVSFEELKRRVTLPKRLKLLISSKTFLFEGEESSWLYNCLNFAQDPLFLSNHFCKSVEGQIFLYQRSILASCRVTPLGQSLLIKTRVPSEYLGGKKTLLTINTLYYFTTFLAFLNYTLYFLTKGVKQGRLSILGVTTCIILRYTIYS